MNRCGTCKFWGSDRGDSKGVYRPCRAVIHDSNYDSDLDDEECDHEFRSSTWDEVRKCLAVVTDGSGYIATLRCREDFGCVLHQLKDGNAPTR